MPHNPSAPAEGEGAVGWEVFTSCWALAIWLCNLSRGVASPPARGLLTLLCAVVLVRPRSRWAFGALAVAYGVHFVVDDHVTDTIYTWVVVLSSTMILLALLPTAWGDPAGGPARALASLRPAGTTFAAIWLFSAGFCKLNDDFFTTAQSCGAVMYAYQRQVFPYSLLPDARWAEWIAIVATPAAEISGGSLLLFARTRRVGIVLAASLLFLIGTNDIGRLYAFTSPLFAYMTLGLDWGPLAKRVGPHARRVGLGLAALVVVSLLVSLVFGEKGRVLHGRHAVARVIFVLAAASMIGASALRASAIPLQWRRARLTLLVPLFLFLHESSAYLGLPMSRNVAPADNLTVGPLYSNHFLVRHVPRLPFNRPAVVLRSSDPFLNRARRVWASWALSDYLGRHPDTSVTFELDGQTVRVARAGDDRRFGPSLWARLFPVRPTLAKKATIPCVHSRPGARRTKHGPTKRRPR